MNERRSVLTETLRLALADRDLVHHAIVILIGGDGQAIMGSSLTYHGDTKEVLRQQLEQMDVPIAPPEKIIINRKTGAITKKPELN